MGYTELDVEQVVGPARPLEQTSRIAMDADAVLACMDHAVLTLDPDGSILYANPAATRLLGEVPEGLQGRRFTAHIEIDHRPSVHAALRRAVAGYPVRGLECCVGTCAACTWIQMDASPTEHGCIVVARDLRQRHTLRGGAMPRQERLRDTIAGLLDTIPVAIVISDGHGAPRLVNRAARELLGTHALTPLHQWCATGMLRRADGTPAEAGDVPAALTLADGAPRRDIELQVLRPWGEAVPVLISTDAVLDERGRVVEVCCTLTNIHQRRHIERQLHQAQKMEAIGTLAGSIAHDFNNILCAMTGYSELALLQAEMDERGRDLVEEIKKAGHRAAALTRRLLAFSRTDEPAPRAMRLNAAVSEMEPILRRLIGQDVELRIDLAEDVQHIQADPSQIEQVLLNLVINARDAMPGGGPVDVRTETVRLPDPTRRHRVAAPPGPYAVLTVRDKGAGMDADTLAHVFEPFYTTKARHKGTGLGLSTVYGIVKQGRGAIDVVSRPGAGATFRIYLPCAGAEVLPDRIPLAETPAVKRGGETILVVEDEPLVRSLIREILEERGYAVIEAGHGRDALRRVEHSSTPPHLVVTDVVMPEMGGKEVAAELRREQEDLKVLFVSGYVNEAVVDLGPFDEATAFLPKPFDAKALTRKVRDLLDHVPACS